MPCYHKIFIHKLLTPFGCALNFLVDLCDACMYVGVHVCECACLRVGGPCLQVCRCCGDVEGRGWCHRSLPCFLGQCVPLDLELALSDTLTWSVSSPDLCFWLPALCSAVLLGLAFPCVLGICTRTLILAPPLRRLPRSCPAAFKTFIAHFLELSRTKSHF